FLTGQPNQVAGIFAVEANRSCRGIQHLLDKCPGRFTEVPFACFLVQQCFRNVLCDITRPSLGGIESHHSYWLGVLATADITDDIPFAGVGFIRFDVGATKWAKVVEHQVDGDIIGQLRGKWWGTHDATLHISARQFSPYERARPVNRASNCGAWPEVQLKSLSDPGSSLRHW